MIDTKKLRQQLAEATPGEWKRDWTDINASNGPVCRGELTETDAALICSMKNSLPALLDELDAARGEIERLKYANMKLEAQAFINKYGGVIEKLAKE